MNTKTKHWASIIAGILSLAGYASAASLGSEKYNYDASGNIIEKSIDGKVTRFEYEENTLKNNNQGITYLHDKVGRLLGETRDGNVEKKLTYQFGDKVTKVENGETTTELFYNAEGQLVGKTGAGRTTVYTWDGNVLGSEDNQAFTNESHISGGVPALAGENQIITSDHLGNTLALGNKTLSSSAYGEGLEQARFTGKPYIEELENYIFAYRNYDLATSRWTVKDPLGFPDGVNDYVYVNGDPLSKVDPLGLRTLKRDYSMKSGDVSKFNFSYVSIATYSKHRYDGIAASSIVEETGVMPIQVNQGGSCSYSRTNEVSSTWASTAGISVALWDSVTAQVGQSSGGGSGSGSGASQTWTHPGGNGHYEVLPAKEQIIHTVTRTVTHKNTGTTFTPVWTLNSPPLGPYPSAGRTSYNATGINVYEL